MLILLMLLVFLILLVLLVLLMFLATNKCMSLGAFTISMERNSQFVGRHVHTNGA